MKRLVCWLKGHHYVFPGGFVGAYLVGRHSQPSPILPIQCWRCNQWIDIEWRAAAQPKCHPECVGVEMPPGNLWCNTHNMERDCPKDASCPKCRAAAQPKEKP